MTQNDSTSGSSSTSLLKAVQEGTLQEKMVPEQIIGFSYPFCKMLLTHLKKQREKSLGKPHGGLFPVYVNQLRADLVPVVKYLASQLQIYTRICDTLENPSFGKIDDGEQNIALLIGTAESFLELYEKHFPSAK